MDTPEYIAVLTDAFGKLEDLYRNRASIDGEIMKIEQLIAATSNMLDDTCRTVAMEHIELLRELHRIRETGLTDAIRVILKTNEQDWLTVTNVRDQLLKVGFDFSEYSTNPLASVSAILRRLREEEVETTMLDAGVTGYRWRETKSGRSSEFFKSAIKAIKKQNTE